MRAWVEIACTNDKYPKNQLCDQARDFMQEEYCKCNQIITDGVAKKIIIYASNFDHAIFIRISSLLKNCTCVSTGACSYLSVNIIVGMLALMLVCEPGLRHQGLSTVIML